MGLCNMALLRVFPWALPVPQGKSSHSINSQLRQRSHPIAPTRTPALKQNNPCKDQNKCCTCNPTRHHICDRGSTCQHPNQPSTHIENRTASPNKNLRNRPRIEDPSATEKPTENPADPTNHPAELKCGHRKLWRTPQLKSKQGQREDEDLTRDPTKIQTSTQPAEPQAKSQTKALISCHVCHWKPALKPPE